MSIYDEAIAELQAALKLPWPAERFALDRRAHLLRVTHQNRAVTLSRLSRFADALPDWDRAVELSQGQARDHLRVDRAKVRVRAGHHQQAVAEVEQLRATFAKNAKVTFVLGAICARAALVVGDDPLADRHAELAMELLEEARKLGAFKIEDNRKGLVEEDFNALRRRVDFQNFLDSLS